MLDRGAGGDQTNAKKQRKKVNAKRNPLRLLVDYFQFPFKIASILLKILICWALVVMVSCAPMLLLLLLFFLFNVLDDGGRAHGPHKKPKKGKCKM